MHLISVSYKTQTFYQISLYELKIYPNKDICHIWGKAIGMVITTIEKNRHHIRNVCFITINQFMMTCVKL